MAKREFLQLAHPFEQKKHAVPGWFLSEKLDGMRAFWDGGVTRGMAAELVPWANVEKDTKIKKSTGLWSRYGKVIFAPDNWLAKLPPVFLDGELYLGRGQFQELVSITKRHEADSRWNDVQFKVFDSPPLEAMFADGNINNANFKKTFKGIINWLHTRGVNNWLPASAGFIQRYKALQTLKGIDLHHQEQLPFSSPLALARVDERCNEVCDLGGEGVMLKNPSQFWLPERSYAILKYKPFSDAEGTVVGYTWGKETDKGSKLQGLMGAMILEISAGKFNLSGFTDEERRMTYKDGSDGAFNYGCNHPGELVPDFIHNPKFPRGSVITYKYRELTKDGLPKEARFWRERNDD